MTTSEKIAAAIKPILDEDRRADRERIAELERDLGSEKAWMRQSVADFERKIDELTEKCAALVLEKELARGELVKLREARDAPTLRIDTDMSDPQPGKLLVVRLDGEDSYKMHVGEAPYLARDQFVGFFVETPAVEVKRTPKVGDRVRFVDGSHHQGIIGEVLFKYDGDAFMVGQGSLKYCGKAADLEVIE